MAYKNPPKETRFPVNRPHAPNAGNKGPYLTPLLRKFLKKRIKYEDPETEKMIQGKVKDAVLWRLILNAAQGDNVAIKEIIERIDGKVTTPIEHSGEVKTGEDKIIIIRSQDKKVEPVENPAQRVPR